MTEEEILKIIQKEIGPEAAKKVKDRLDMIRANEIMKYRV